MKPAALAKAEALERHAKYLGVRPADFGAVTITLSEAYELLDYLAAQHPGNPVLAKDIVDAKQEANPWRVLANFQVLGFEILRADALH